MNRGILAAALAAGWAFGAAGPAAADTFGPWTPKTAPVAEYGNVYISFGAGAFVQQIPRVNFGNIYAVGGGNPFLTLALSDDPDVVGGEGGGTVGFVFDTRRSPSWLGRKPRIEVAFSYGRGGASAAQSQTFGAGTVTLLSGPLVSGELAGGIGAGGATHRGRVDVALQEIAGAIRLKTDVRLTRTLSATPALGFVGGQSVFDFDYRTTFTSPLSATDGVRELAETLKTRRLGGEAAIDLAWRAARRITVHGGASAAVFRMGTRLTGNDCFGFGAGAAGLPCSGNFGTTTRSDFDHRTGYRIGMNAGLTYDGGWFKLTVVGRAAWDSDQPGIRNPTAPNTSSGSAPAEIVYDSAWRFGGGLSVTIPLN